MNQVCKSLVIWSVFGARSAPGGGGNRLGRQHGTVVEIIDDGGPGTGAETG